MFYVVLFKQHNDDQCFSLPHIACIHLYLYLGNLSHSFQKHIFRICYTTHYSKGWVEGTLARKVFSLGICIQRREQKKKKKEGQRIRQGLDGKCIGRVWSLVSVQCEVTVGFCSAQWHELIPCFKKITLATPWKMVWRRGQNKSSDLLQRLLQCAGQRQWWFRLAW